MAEAQCKIVFMISYFRPITWKRTEQVGQAIPSSLGLPSKPNYVLYTHINYQGDLTINE